MIQTTMFIICIVPLTNISINLYQWKYVEQKQLCFKTNIINRAIDMVKMGNYAIVGL